MKRRNFFLQKKLKRKMKNIKKSQNEEIEKLKNQKQEKDKKTGEKKVGKNVKRAQMGFVPPSEMGPKLFFYMRTVKRNRHEIEARKKTDFEHPTKKK